MGMYVGVVYRREYLRHVSDYVPIVCGYLYLCVHSNWSCHCVAQYIQTL